MVTLVLGVALVACVVCAGCGGTIPESRYYVLDYPGAAAQAAGESAGRLEVVIGIDALGARPLYRDRRIAYRLSDHELAYYPYRFWAADPGELVSSQLADHLRRRAVAMAVVEQPFDLMPDWVIAGRIQRFEEVDRGEGWFAVFEIAVLVEDARSGDPLVERILHREIPTEQRTPEAVARAMSVAVGEVGDEIVTMLRRAAENNLP
jgi:ABC-type uncharacterized transport system auxiliary subunit